jgi:hypothetical protein
MTTTDLPEWARDEARAICPFGEAGEWTSPEGRQITIKHTSACASCYRIAAALVKAEARPCPCSTCGGTPHPSGLLCVCGGKNTCIEEISGLRIALFNEREANAKARAEGIEAAANSLAAVRDSYRFQMGKSEPDLVRLAFHQAELENLADIEQHIRALKEPK